MPKSQDRLRNLMQKFNVYGDYLVGVPFGNGHVNDTFRITYKLMYIYCKITLKLLEYIYPHLEVQNERKRNRRASPNHNTG